MNNLQIKSKQRVSEFGEVYTAQREVNAMLNLVGDEVRHISSTVLEPACGIGNFLVEIIRRKLETVKRVSSNSFEYELYAALAFSSIYGVDILQDNVKASRQRMLDVFMSEYPYAVQNGPQKSCLNAINFIMKRNIQCGDTLTMLSYKGQPLTISEWFLTDSNEFRRLDVLYKDMVNGIEDNYIKRYKYDWFVRKPLNIEGELIYA
ncbi:MAG: hypothetical protein MR458_04340 [Erysipelotrichaceae bacterium]|nr:hypothetical protein [Erysipelotrichaceae bacterium]